MTKLRWVKGGDAEILSIAVDQISLSSSEPAPPGARIEGDALLQGTSDDAMRLRLRIKVHGCKKQPDGRFQIEGRPLDLSRADLERIGAHRR